MVSSSGSVGQGSPARNPRCTEVLPEPRRLYAGTLFDVYEVAPNDWHSLTNYLKRRPLQRITREGELDLRRKVCDGPGQLRELVVNTVEQFQGVELPNLKRQVCQAVVLEVERLELHKHAYRSRQVRQPIVGAYEVAERP
eukprot:2294578-Prymnesium_polylepis.1